MEGSNQESVPFPNGSRVASSSALAAQAKSVPQAEGGKDGKLYSYSPGGGSPRPRCLQGKVHSETTSLGLSEATVSLCVHTSSSSCTCWGEAVGTEREKVLALWHLLLLGHQSHRERPTLTTSSNLLKDPSPHNIR